MTITWAQVALAAIAAVPPTIAAIAALRSSKKNNEKIDKADHKLNVVHELVNSRLTSALDKIDRLERQLQDLTGRTPTGEMPANTELGKPTDLIPRR